MISLRRQWSRLAVPVLLLAIMAGGPALAASERTASPQVRQLAPDATCAILVPGSSELSIDLTGQSVSPGKLFSATGGTQILLVLIREVAADGTTRSADVAASQPFNALILRGTDAESVQFFDPAVTTAAKLSAEDGEGLTRVTACYKVAIPRPPSPVVGSPSASAVATTVRTTPTPASYEMNGVQTSVALEATVAARETAIASQEAVLATAQASATAAAIASQTAAVAEQTAAASATSASQTAVAAAESAQQTAVVAATATAWSQQGTEVLNASTSDDFDAFALPADGWTNSASTNGSLRADGSPSREWVLLPGVAVQQNYAVEIEMKIDPTGDCPRNVGFAIRASEAGYYAAGIEWACEPTMRIWAGQQVIANRDWQPDSDWHTYRFEVMGDQLRVLVDGVVVLAATSDAFPEGTQIALWSDGVAVTIRAVRVRDLD